MTGLELEEETQSALAEPKDELDSAIVISSLAPGERVILRTRNSVYEFVMLQPTQHKVSVSGGRHFPHLTEAHLFGCSEGSGRRDSIALGRRLEFTVGPRLFVTSVIVSIERESEDAAVALRKAVPRQAGETLDDVQAEVLPWRRLSPILTS